MSESIAFLTKDVSRLMRRRFDERARAIGATNAQWRVLLALSRREGINQGGLAEVIEVEPITLCRMIDRLEEAGFVERRRDPSDRRAWNIFLTEASRPILTELRVLGDALIEEMFDGVPEADRAILTRSLNRMRDNLLDRAEPKEAAHG